MKRVIVIVLLAIILAMLVSRRENLTPKCPTGKELVGGLCYTPCPAGTVANGPTCRITTCPTGKIDMGVNCCARNKYNQFVNCTPKVSMRAGFAPQMV
jgi:hypothetical protein